MDPRPAESAHGVVEREGGSIERQFKQLAGLWKRNTAHMSIVARKVADPSYQDIIAMGAQVVPLILKGLEREPKHWFVALRALTGQNPAASRSPGDVKGTVESWLQWGRSEKLI